MQSDISECQDLTNRLRQSKSIWNNKHKKGKVNNVSTDMRLNNQKLEEMASLTWKAFRWKALKPGSNPRCKDGTC